jgi:xanthine dehydrogenase iron-sulfur cluster and FAD-binding subunit A
MVGSDHDERNPAATHVESSTFGDRKTVFCTSGFRMALAELWPKRGRVTGEEIEKAISGQLCRCTGYAGILAAARAAFGVDR